jgi:hypothetical protein
MSQTGQHPDQRRQEKRLRQRYDAECVRNNYSNEGTDLERIPKGTSFVLINYTTTCWGTNA